METKSKFRALKKEPKAYVYGWNGDDYTDSKWVYGSGVIPVYNNTYPTDEMEMVIDVNYDELDYWQPSYSTCKIIPNTVGQYIWKTDKNGKEIYDGDIVRIHQFLFDGCEYEKEIVVSIERMKDTACFGANLLQAKEIKEYMGYSNEADQKEKVVVPLCNFYGLHEESFEVVGNIYENMDLLKEIAG